MIEDIYTEALLAAAAYADWSLLGTPREFEIKDELMSNRGFTEAQYETFFDPNNGLYEVIPNGYTSDINGFSATIFKEKATGKLIVAFRGTDGLLDWDTNIEVVLGIDVLDFMSSQDDNINTFLENAGLVVGDVLQTGINFTGHSLGGYLATMASYKYVDTMGTTSTFNGLGTTLATVLSQEIILGTSLDGKVNNYYADFVGANVGFHPGEKTEIFIENESELEDHSIDKLVESLSVYRVLGLLNPDFDTDAGMQEIYIVLNATSNVAAQSLESIIDQLGDFLGGTLATDTIKADVELFYQAVQEAGTSYNIAAVTSSSIANLATQDTEAGRGYLYSLVNLLPFAVTSNLVGTAAEDALYDLNDTNGDRFYSDAYLTDKAQMLEHVITRNTLDRTYPPIGAEGEPVYFHDFVTGESFVTGQVDIPGGGQAYDEVEIKRVVFGDNSDNSFLSGGEQADYLYGQGGNDVLNGRDGADYIEGGTGADTIIGGLGHGDVLIGGAGQDVFVFNHVDGFDFIKDADTGGDRILLNGDELGTLTIDPIPRLGAYIPLWPYRYHYRDAKGNVYVHDSSAQTLLIKAAGIEANALLIENYTPSVEGALPEDSTDFGIVLPENTGMEIVPVEGYIDALAEGSSRLFYQAFFYESDDTVATDDNIYVSDFSGNDPLNNAYVGLISSFGGDDVIVLSENPDEDNYVSAELVGGKGSDTIYGAAGWDLLVATEVNIIEGESLDEADEVNELFGGAGSDILVGASYDDTLVGGAGEDWIFAGTGNDTIYGGTGADYILADSFMSENTEGILFTNNYIGADFNPNRPDFSVNGDLELPDHDFIDGGKGNDAIEGGRGNDVITGGEGADVIAGDRMNTADFWKIVFRDEERYPTQEHRRWSTQYIALNPALHGNDVIDAGSARDNIVFGNGGHDIITGAGYIQGDDYLISGEFHGDDVIYLKNSSIAEGNGGSDLIYGSASRDIIWGDQPDDPEESLMNFAWSPAVALDSQYHGNDVIHGGEGWDTIYGGGGNDRLFGEGGVDVLFGGDGDDWLDGGEGGGDKAYGGAGNDTLVANGANDKLIGESGNDVYLVSGAESGGYNYIEDDEGANSIIFSGSVGFSELEFSGAGSMRIRSPAGSGFATIIMSYATFDSIKEIVVGGKTYSQYEFLTLADNSNTGGLVTGDQNANTISGGLGGDNIFGREGDDQLFGEGGSDGLVGGVGNDLLDGGSGRDFLVGVQGDDFLKGGLGNDTLIGGAGGDTYVIDYWNAWMPGSSSGVETIWEIDNTLDSSTDTVRFEDGITLSDVIFGFENDYEGVLTIGLSGSTDKWMIYRDEFANLYYTSDDDVIYSEFPIEQFQFYNAAGNLSATYNYQEVKSIIHSGSEGDDIINGTPEGDFIQGNEGDDVIYLGEGNDTVRGGAGNDYISDGTQIGHVHGPAEIINTILFGLGDGHDEVVYSPNTRSSSSSRVVFDASVLPTDVSIRRVYDDKDYAVKILIDVAGQDSILFGGTADVSDSTYNTIDTVEFSNGTVWDAAAIQLMLVTPTDEGEVLNGPALGLDNLTPGKGDDYLFLQDGDVSTTLHFNPGDGHDFVRSGENIVFGPGILPADVSFHRRPDQYSEYTIFLNGSGDSIRIYMDNGQVSPIKLIQFADAPNTVYNEDDIYDFLQVGTDQDDYLNGQSKLNSQLDGGAGNDRLRGGSGPDTYFFGSGYGHDFIDEYIGHGSENSIVMLEGILPEDVQVNFFDGRTGYLEGTSAYGYQYSRDGLLLSIGGDDHLLTDEFFAYYAYYGIFDPSEVNVQSVEFSDGTVWTAEDIFARMGRASDQDDLLLGRSMDEFIEGLAGNDQLYGGEGSDSLQGGDGDDILHGGGDDDSLDGGAGNDQYMFSAGHGRDTIYSQDKTSGRFDIISYDASVKSGDILVRRVSDDLYIELPDSLDSIRIRNHFITRGKNSGHHIDGIQFDGGEFISRDDIDALLAISESGSYSLTGDSGSNTLMGYGGNDQLMGNGGDDSLRGGAGDDTLLGGDGSDVLTGGKGVDVLTGGAGNDSVSGGAGNDIYIFNIGDGHDTISNDDLDKNSLDVLQLGSAIFPDQVSLERANDDLKVIVSANDSVTVSNFFLNAVSDFYLNSEGGVLLDDPHIIDRIEFADGSFWDFDDLNTLTPNLVPLTNADHFITDEDTAIFISLQALLVNDRDFDRDELSLESVSYNGSGSVEFGDSYISYTPAQDSDATDSFEYTLTDGKARSSSIVTIDVNAVNDAPLLIDDQLTTIQNTAVNVTVAALLSNDTDVEGDPLQFVGVSNARGGTAVYDDIAGEVNFTPTIDFVGDAIFDYEVSDGQDTSTATVVVTVGQANTAPVVVDDTISAVENQALSIPAADLLANDSDADGDTLTITGVSNAVGGSAVWDQATSSIAFTPSSNYVGPAIFSYTVTDGITTDSANVNVDVAIDTSIAKTIVGTTGSDALTGGNTADRLFGLAGNDTLVGARGNDLLNGGEGNDALTGDKGSDTYIFAAGYGQDTIDNSTSSKSDTDILQFAGDITADMLQFSQSGDDLLVNLLGTIDTVTVQNWYTNEASQLEEIHTDDAIIYTSDVDALVSAMASFSAPEEDSSIVTTEMMDDTNLSALSTFL